MPRLPILSGREIITILERLGFKQVRQRGSLMKREDRGCVIPLHDEVKKGTLAGILRQAQLSVNDFLAEHD